MKSRFMYKVTCPICNRGKVLSTGNANICTSNVCPKCKNTFTVNWKTLDVYPSDKIKNNNSSH